MGKFIGERPSDVPRWAWIAVHVFIVVLAVALTFDVALLFYLVLS